MRSVLILVLAAILLSGCGNVVFSEGPLFTTADARGATRFKPGLWLAEEPHCEVDLTQRRDKWPTCARPMTMTRRGPGDPAFWEDKRPLLVAGDPLILQLSFEPPDEHDTHYYWALRVTARDRRGRAKAISMWPVLCGPPRPNEGEDGHEPSRRLTMKLLPGLEARGNNCIARDPGAVRQAADASEPWTPEPSTARWIAPR